MFTQNCCIKKNTKELRDKLKALGYKLNHGKTWGKYLVCFKINGTEECRFVATPEYDLKNMPDFKNAIDCGTNEELFLAIAALSDDTNEHQWFTDGSHDIWVVYDSNEMVYDSDKMTYDRYKDCYVFDWYEEDAHKATVEELIEHFENS